MCSMRYQATKRNARRWCCCCSRSQHRSKNSESNSFVVASVDNSHNPKTTTSSLRHYHHRTHPIPQIQIRHRAITKSQARHKHDDVPAGRVLSNTSEHRPYHPHCPYSHPSNPYPYPHPHQIQIPGLSSCLFQMESSFHPMRNLDRARSLVGAFVVVGVASERQLRLQIQRPFHASYHRTHQIQ